MRQASRKSNGTLIYTEVLPYNSGPLPYRRFLVSLLCVLTSFLADEQGHPVWFTYPSGVCTWSSSQSNPNVDTVVTRFFHLASSLFFQIQIRSCCLLGASIMVSWMNEQINEWSWSIKWSLSGPRKITPFWLAPMESRPSMSSNAPFPLLSGLLLAQHPESPIPDASR